MSILETPLRRSAAAPLRDVVGRALVALDGDAGRAVLAVVAVVVAYHYSLLSLVRSLNVETPLAYLGLVPVISLVLMAGRIRPAPGEPAIHDRQVDYIIGLPMLLSALALVVLMPIRLSTMFWVWRIDLLSFPLFVSGTICLLFGVRALWRLRLPVLFLLLAWPLPYTILLLRWLQTFTDTTLFGLRHAVHVIPVAHPLAGSDGSLFSVPHAGREFTVSVASACSGVNGVVGYVLIGAAFLSVVSGKLLRKALWLLTGMVLIWALNVLRIVAIFAAGHKWGEGVAIDGLHPFIGLVTFNIGVLLMVLVMGRFGLEFRFGTARARRADTELPVSPTPARPVPRVRLAVAIVVALAAVSGVANASLASYDLVAGSLGSPRLASFSANPQAPKGWVVTKADEYTWARRYFGEKSTWVRYRFDWLGQQVPLRSSAGIIGDIIQTDDLSRFSAYGIEACYRFHGYKLKAVRTVDLGGGVVGNVLSYYNTKLKSDWTTVYWHWPVHTPQGTRYERVALLLINSADSSFTAPLPSPSVARAIGLKLQNALGGSSGGDKVDQRMAKTRAFLVAFAADLIKHMPAASDVNRPKA